VLQRRENRLLIYSADFPAMNVLVAYFTENCCGEQAQSCMRTYKLEDVTPATTSKKRSHA
jgi:hypothetical protein